MADLLINELRALRNTCSQVRDAHGLDGGGLDDAILKLNQMIVDRSLKEGMEIERREQLALSGYPGESTPADARLAAAARAPADLLRSDHAFWQGYADAAALEAASAPGKGRDEIVDRAKYGQIERFLRSHFGDEPDVRVTDMSVMAQGYSKKTYLVALAGNRGLPGEIVVRADQSGHYISTTVRDEYDLLRALEEYRVPIPRPLALEPGGDVIGNAFMIVAKVEGDMVGDPYNGPPANEALTRSTAQAMAGFHSVPISRLQAAGIKFDPAHPHIDEDFANYDRMWRDMNVYCPTLDVAFAWLRENMHAAYGMNTLVHNDFSYNNMLVADDRVAAVLDWEFAHVGNPAADLSYHKIVADKMSGFDLFKRFYAEAGRPLPSEDELDFYFIWGMTRLGVMILQAQSMFDDARNLDMRFAIAAARYLRHPMLAIGQRLGEIFSRKQQIARKLRA